MTSIAFSESEERQTLRREVSRLAAKYGREWFTDKARAGEKTTDLWLEIGKNGYLGINIPEEHGAGAAASATSPRCARSSPRRAAHCC